MSKTISQETFDDVVKENIVDFSMTADEARKETIEQFEAQGINLANIIKDLSINPETGTPVLNDVIDKLKQHIDEKSTETTELLTHIKILDEECQKSIPHRVLASKNGAYDVLNTLLEQNYSNFQPGSNENQPNLQILESCLQAMNSLLNNQPDLFDTRGLTLALKLLTLVQEENIFCLALQWLQKACIMHETNRQHIMGTDIILQLKPLLTAGQNTRVVREVMTVLRYLVLDDDIRVEFGRAHEHARQIASEVIVELTKLLGVYEDTSLLADCLLTLGVLAVRQEFCTTIESAGGLELVFEIMTANPNAVRLNREALKFLRALAGNDSVKLNLVQRGVAPVIKQLLETHISNESLVSVALICISTLTLRVKENSKAFFDTGIAEIIVEAVRLHPNSKTVMRNASWAIRNMVSRSREQCDTWLSFGIEDLLNTAMTEHITVGQDIKAALRDLGCKVDLKEEWTGTAEKKILNAM